MGAVPTENEEDGGEGVERKEEAEASEDGGREEPGGDEAVGRVEGSGCAHEAVYMLHVRSRYDFGEAGLEVFGQP